MRLPSLYRGNPSRGAAAWRLFRGRRVEVEPLGEPALGRAGRRAGGAPADDGRGAAGRAPGRGAPAHERARSRSSRRIREAAAEVARRARHVRIENERARRAAPACSPRAPGAAVARPGAIAGSARGEHASPTCSRSNAINFGSGWFPHLAKRAGLSGYLTIADGLRERFEREGPWSAAELAQLSAADCARLFGQELAPPVSELMELFARALRDLGGFLAREHRGRFAGPVEEARGSRERLVRLARRACRSTATSPATRGSKCPSTSAPRSPARIWPTRCGGRGLGQFRDLDELTLFADNLVPHVLRSYGVLALLAGPRQAHRRRGADPVRQRGGGGDPRVRAARGRAPGRLVRAPRLARAAAPARLPALVARPEPRVKARPRHRTRCPYY